MIIADKIKKDLKKAIKKALKIEVKDLHLERPENPIHGDYSSNFAMAKFERVNKEQRTVNNPLELAQKIVENFPKTKYLEKIEAVAPGFINFYLKNEVFTSQLKEILKQKDKYGSNKIGKGKTIIIDYSSPNIARPFTVGHLRSTIIGQAIYNVYKFLGYKVIGDNHTGDWGTQFGKLIYAIRVWSDPKKLSSMNVQNLVNLYVRFHEEAVKNPCLDEQGRLWFKKLEEGHQEAQQIWQQCIDISWKEFNRIYDLLGIKIDFAFGESFYKDKMQPIINEAKELCIAKESEGALVIDVDKKIPPVLMLKSDGATTYHMRDLATIKFRQDRFGPVYEMIYEVGKDHSLHFQQLFAAAKKFSWGKNVRYTHVAHGMMRLSTGKMQTRKGKTVFLENVLKEAVDKAKKIIEEKNPDLKPKEKKEISKVVGIGAVKYNDLSQHYSRDIVFNWDKMLNLKGDSAPYLQYTHARACSILRKGVKTLLFFNQTLVREKEEIALVKLLCYFPEMVEESAKKYSPNLICNYLFELAQNFNNFYEALPVLKAKTKDIKKVRLALVKATAQVLRIGLNLLGISSPERM